METVMRFATESLTRILQTRALAHTPNSVKKEGMRGLKGSRTDALQLPCNVSLTMYQIRRGHVTNVGVSNGV